MSSSFVLFNVLPSYGISFVTHMIIVMVMSVITAVGAAGVPGGSIPLLVGLLVMFGILSQINRSNVEQSVWVIGLGIVALVAAAHKFKDGDDALPAHGVGGAGKQHLDLHVVEAGGAFGEIAAGLVMKILQKIVGEAGGETGIIDFPAGSGALAFGRHRDI